MAKIEKIYIEESYHDGKSIRLDWDNNRHQRFGISPPYGAREVIEALIAVSELLLAEEKAGMI